MKGRIALLACTTALAAAAPASATTGVGAERQHAGVTVQVTDQGGLTAAR